MDPVVEARGQCASRSAEEDEEAEHRCVENRNDDRESYDEGQAEYVDVAVRFWVERQFGELRIKT